MSLMFDVIFPMLFCGVLFGVVFVFVRAIKGARENRTAPRLTVAARVVAKRYRFDDSFNRYFATFEVESGDRLELSLTGPEYGQLAEGDEGRLTFQGNRFIEFEIVRF